MKKLICLVPLVLTACGPAPEDRFPPYHTAALDEAPVTLRQTPQGSDLIRPYTSVETVETRQARIDMQRALHEAAERAFGYSGPADVLGLLVGDREFQMRIVDVDGIAVAVLDQPGIPLTFRNEPDLSREVQAVVGLATGCITPGGVARKSYPNGAHSRYAVPLDCT